MKGGADQKGHAALLMHSERHLDPSKPCAHLKEDQKEVEDAEHQDDRYSTDVHFKNPSFLELLKTNFRTLIIRVSKKDSTDFSFFINAFLICVIVL